MTKEEYQARDTGRDRLRRWRVPISNGIVIIASAILGALPIIQSKWRAWQTWLPGAIAALVIVIGGVCNIVWDSKRVRLDEEFASLRDERDRIKSLYADLNQAHKEMAQRWIHVEALRMGMGPLDRLSLFVLRKNGGGFLLCARYSGHGEWREIRTIEYPMQGSIYAAMQQGLDDSGALPDPDKNLAHYTKALGERYSYKVKAVRESRMKARRIQSWRIEDRDGEAIAVLTAESKDPHRSFFGGDAGGGAAVTVRECLSDDMMPIIQRCIGSIRDHDESSNGVSPALIEEV